MGALGLRRVDDLARGQADALIGDVHPAVARAEGDLLGAVGMTVEARLADEELQPTPEAVATRHDRGADIVETLGLVRAFERPWARGIRRMHRPHFCRPIRRW
jgi:hypothetical protein